MKKLITYVCLAALLSGCQTEKMQLINLGIDDVYLVPRMKCVYMHSAYTGDSYEWTIKTSESGDSLLSREKDYVFLPEFPGVYDLTFKIFDQINPLTHHIKIHVVEEETAYSPYIAHVYEYRPAPGQFVNSMPTYASGDTEEDMRRKAEEAISGKNQGGVSLGSYGGYVTFGFDHTVLNKRGMRDFYVEGNSFTSAQHPGVNAGSSEPGIVMVAFDDNQNGKPDDKWYEIDMDPAYTAEIASLDYRITYYRPDPDKKPVPDKDGVLTDLTYVKWEDNRGGQDYVYKNKFHTQEYYPQWIEQDRISFEGTLLRQNGIDVSGNGSYYLLYMFERGAYVDNFANGMVDDQGNNRCSFDIGWAVDPDTRQRVHLKGIDFIRVYTAINQYCGWLGDTSTEVYHARDLHIYVRPVRPGE